MSGTILDTDRLLLRYQTHADIDALVKIWSNKVVTEYIGAPRNVEFLKSEFEKTAGNPHAEKFDLWVLIEKATGRIIGHCGYIDKAIEDRTEIDLTYILDPAFWGKGYATEIAVALRDYAFTNMGISRLIALVHPENKASANVAKKTGMILEKRLERSNGEIRDMFSITKND